MGYWLILYIIASFYPLGVARFPLGVIVYPVITIFLAVISKKIFGKGFMNARWKTFFVVSMMFSVIALGLFGLLMFDSSIHSLHLTEKGAWGIFLGALFSNLVPFIFFISYSASFIVRLVRRGKEKKQADVSRD